MAARVKITCEHRYIEIISIENSDVSRVHAIPSGDCCFLVTNGGNCIYLYRNRKRKAILYFPNAVQHVCTDITEHNTTMLWCATKDDKLYCIEIDEYLKRKSKRKHKKTSAMKSAQCDPDTSNQDIFAGLLSDDEKMNVKDAEDADDDDIEISVSTEYVIMVEEKDLFMEARNINAILPLQGHIIVCSYERNDIIVSVYRGKVDGMERKDTNAFLLYRTFISLKQTLGGGLNEVASQTLYTPRNRNCILVCSMPSSVDKPRVHSEKILFLEPSYFSMLFGPENCLTDCPVILMSTPDGRIFYLPMKNLKNDIPAGGFSLPIFPLYNMEERLMNIHDMYLHSPKMDAVTTEEAPSNALVLVGNSGKIVIISNQKGRLNFKVYNVRGPVLCSSVHCTSQLLVYCTQSNTYIARITNANSCDARNSSKFNSHAALLPNVLTPVDTGICGVLDVICTNTGHEAGSVHLSALKHNGQVVKITMKTGNHEDDITTYTTAAIAGQKIKELLSLISSVSEKLVEQNTKIDTVNCALEELNQAAHIACTINDGSVDSLESGFKCVVVPYVKDRGCTCEYGVTIKLTNDSPWILTSSWCWIICIQDRQVWSEGTAKQITKSVHFNHLQPGDFHEIDIPLDCDDDVQFSLPITVSSYLHFNTLQVMERLDINAAFPESDITLSENGICLQLSTDMLDVLHFLRTLPRTALLTSVGCRGLFSRQGSKLEYTLHQIAQHRPACESGQADAKTLEGHRFTAKVLISTELVHHYIVKEGDLITEDNKSALQSQLLNLLFTKNVMLPDSEVIQLLTPQGFHITVMCNLVVMDKNQVIELKIMTDSVALLCQLHKAVLIRFKSIMKTCSKTTNTSVYKLKQEMLRLQDLEHQFRKLEDEYESSSCVSAATQILQFYEKMRQTCLDLEHQLRKLEDEYESSSCVSTATQILQFYEKMRQTCLVIL